MFYFMEYVFMYVGKPFNFRLNNNRSDVFHRNAISACRHFDQDQHSLTNIPNLHRFKL